MKRQPQHIYRTGSVQHRQRVKLRVPVLKRQNRLDLRSEEKVQTFLRIEERFLSNPVSCQEKFSLFFIPESKGEHATDVFDAVFTKIFVEMNNCFGV